MTTIRFTGITRRFPGITALDSVSFAVEAGTCHAICGENGAGKSTLGRILAGIDRADAGNIELGGTVARLTSPRDARAAGIAMVHQELALCPNLTVAENLGLAHLPSARGFLDRAALRSRAREMLAEVGAGIEPSRVVSSLSVAEQQLVQIAAAVGAAARVIILDEPTSSLGDREAERLYEVIGSLTARGTTVIYVSHRMPEIFRLAQRVTVLRDGQHVATKAIGEVDEAALVELMIGRRLDQFFPAHAGSAPGDELLAVRDLSTRSGVRDVSFRVRAGEVVGLAGLVGAGRSEVARAIFGLEPLTGGRVAVGGTEVRVRTARDAMRRGIGFVPEDRKRQGLVLGMRNRENASLPTLSRFARWGWVRGADEAEAARGAFDRVQMRAGPDVETGTLSGGNQQKVVLAKWLAATSRILILDEPTRGVDVGAKAELHAWIDQFAAAGGAVLLISSEMPELLNLSTRIHVLRKGRLVGTLERAEATQDRLLRLMSGLAA